MGKSEDIRDTPLDPPQPPQGMILSAPAYLPLSITNHLLAAPELTREHGPIFSVKHEKMHMF